MMRIQIAPVAAIAAAALLAGCSVETSSDQPGENASLVADDQLTDAGNDVLFVPPSEGNATMVLNDSAPPEATGNVTTGGDGSPLVLAPITPSDAEMIEGELACSFAANRGSAPILLGKGVVASEDRPVAVIRIGDYPQRMMRSEGAGFAALERGGTYSGKGMTVTITPGARVTDSTEATRSTATLLAQRGDGAERSYDGVWTCGP